MSDLVVIKQEVDARTPGTYVYVQMFFLLSNPSNGYIRGCFIAKKFGGLLSEASVSVSNMPSSRIACVPIAFVSRRHWLRGTVRCERKKATLRIAALHYSAELATLWARTGDRDVHCWDLASDAGVANHIAYVRHSSYSVPTPSLVTDRSARECSMLITRGRAVQRHLVVLI